MTFYATKVNVIIYSPEPISPVPQKDLVSDGNTAPAFLKNLVYDMNQGRVIGASGCEDSEEINSHNFAQRVIELGSSPEFFGLDRLGYPLGKKLVSFDYTEAPATKVEVMVCYLGGMWNADTCVYISPIVRPEHVEEMAIAAVERRLQLQKAGFIGVYVYHITYWEE